MKKFKFMIMRLFRYFLMDFYYSKHGDPIKCQYCGSKRFGCLNTEFIEGIVCEKYYICSDCGKYVAFWAYGSYDPAYKDNIFKLKG